MSISADQLRSAAEFLEGREATATRPDLVAAAKFLRDSADLKDYFEERLGQPPTAADKSRGHGNIGAAK